MCRTGGVCMFPQTIPQPIQAVQTMQTMPVAQTVFVPQQQFISPALNGAAANRKKIHVNNIFLQRGFFSH